MKELLTNEEEGFTICTAAHHQGSIEMLWLHFWEDFMLSILIYECMIQIRNLNQVVIGEAVYTK